MVAELEAVGGGCVAAPLHPHDERGAALEVDGGNTPAVADPRAPADAHECAPDAGSAVAVDDRDVHPGARALGRKLRANLRRLGANVSDRGRRGMPLGAAADRGPEQRNREQGGADPAHPASG